MQRLLKLLVFLLLLPLASVSTAFPQSASSAKPKAKLPKQIDLDKNLDLVRDPVTGELTMQLKAGAELNAHSSSTSPSNDVIRSVTRLLLAPCSVTNPQETTHRDLTERDFQIAVDGAPQQIAYLDLVAHTPASVLLVLDASPSEGHAIGDMKAAARSLAAGLAPEDQVAVVAFAGHAHLILPFSTDRTLLESALNRVEVMRSEMEVGSNIYGAVYLAAHQLFGAEHQSSNRNAIVVLTDGQDSGLDLSWNPASMRAANNSNSLAFDDVAKELNADNLQLFVVSTENRPRQMTPVWLRAHDASTLISSESHRLQIPAYTIFLAELVRQVGGSLYFLRESGTLADVYSRIAATLRSECVLGVLMAGEIAQPGWHRISIAFTNPASHQYSQLDCRRSYYVSPASLAPPAAPRQ